MEIEIVIKVIGLTMLALLPMVNPPTSATLLLGLSKGKEKSYVQKQAKLASIYLFLTLTVTLFIGSSILDLFNISVPSLRLGGGLIIGAIGFNMLFPVPSSVTVSDQEDSIAFVPLTIPTMCGPGTMALIISSVAGISTMDGQIDKLSVYSGIVIGFAGVSLIAWLVLSMAYPMLRLLGRSGVDAFTRIMGFLLVCMGAQFCVNGFVEVYETMILPLSNI